MDAFFELDETSIASKGIVFIGNRIVTYRRDRNTKNHPMYIDLPGGVAKAGETPFQTFQREVKEEFGLNITKKNIVYARRYPSTSKLKNKYGYFVVAKLPEGTEAKIIFGNEGLEYKLLSLEEYLNLPDAWPIYQVWAKDYLDSLAREI